MKGRECTWEGRREQRIRDKREENQSVKMEKGKKERGKEIMVLWFLCQFSTQNKRVWETSTNIPKNLNQIVGVHHQFVKI